MPTASFQPISPPEPASPLTAEQQALANSLVQPAVAAATTPTSIFSPAPTGTFSQPEPTTTIELKLPGVLTQAQLFAIYQNLPYYQAHGYPIAEWNALSSADQTILLQAGIHPTEAPVAAAATSSTSTGTVVAVAGLGVVGLGALWYFLL